VAVAGSLESNGMAPPTEIKKECIRQLLQIPKLESNASLMTGLGLV